jgi:death-on-curing protein
MTEYLELAQVIEAHDSAIKQFGGLNGIRDKNLLMSAVDTPKAAMFGQELYPTVYNKAAAYLYHIVCNHPFIDGNKRTGFIATILFLQANNIPIVFEGKKFESFVVEVAKGEKTKEQIAYFLEHGKESHEKKDKI